MSSITRVAAAVDALKAVSVVEDLVPETIGQAAVLDPVVLAVAVQVADEAVAVGAAAAAMEVAEGLEVVAMAASTTVMDMEETMEEALRGV